MKVTVKETKKLSKIIYPCILKDTKSKLIILATDSETGTCLSPDNGFKTGDWFDTWDFDEFIRFDGLVTLEND
jgi:hypothetical protein